MSQDSKQTTNSTQQYLPWIVVAVLGYMLFARQPAPVPPTPGPDDNRPVPVVVSIESTVKQVKADQLKALATSFETLASEVEAGKFKYARELLEYMNPLTKEAREAANKPFDLMVGNMIPDELTGKEKQVADDLRKVAKAWLR
jgi:hypothetical protein